MDRICDVKSQLDQLSEALLLVAQAEDEAERTEYIMAMQREIRQIYASVKLLEDAPALVRM